MNPATAAVRSGVQSLPPSGVYSLKWNNFSQHLATGLRKLFDEDDYTDVTLACDGQFIRAHKFLLSLCSPFFKKLFQVNKSGRKGSDDTIVILNNVRFKDLESILRFIYNGEANVSNTDLSNFLRTGELLQIEGLSGFGADQPAKESENVGAGAISSSRDDARSSTSPAGSVLPSTSQAPGFPVCGYRPAPVGNGQRIASTSSGLAQAKKSKLAPSRKLRSLAPAPAHRQSQTYNAINEEVDPLEIGDVDLQNTSMCESIDDMQQEASEIMMNDNDLKGEQFQYYSSETANEEQMLFDESNEDINVFDGYQQEEVEPCPSQKEISLGPNKPTRVVQSNGSHSRAAAPRTRTTSVDSEPGRGQEEHSSAISSAQLRPGSLSPNSLLQMNTALNQSSSLIPGIKRSVLCVLCGKYFKNKNSLKVHRSTSHRGTYVLQRPEGGLDLNERDSVPVPIQTEPPDVRDVATFSITSKIEVEDF